MPIISATRASRRGAPILLLGLLASACTKDSSTGVNLPVFANNPCTSGANVALAVSASTRIDCGNGGTTVTLQGGGASYVIVPEFATDQAPLTLVHYSVASGQLASASSSAPSLMSRTVTSRESAVANGLLPAPRNLRAQTAADRRLRESAMSLSRAGRFQGAINRAHTAAIISATPPAVGSIRAFQVLSSFTVDQHATVNAQLAYVGNNILLYVDTLTPANGFTPTQVTNFGQYFDQVLFPIDTTAFGQPSDVDGNQRFIMLMSPIVNADTPAATCSTDGFVAGFFDTEDFVTGDPNSNNGEIFYTIVPDPAALKSCTHTVADVNNDVPAVFLHELEHLISFSQHVIVHGGQPLDGWADEGLAIVAEELGSVHYEQMCPPPACRANASQIFPDSSQGFVSDLLFDSYRYAQLPDTASITLHTDADGGSSWRGGTWLLMRYLTDQKGNAFLRSMMAGPSNGVLDIEASMGAAFPILFSNFGLALYTDSLPGLARATAPALNRFVTRNPKQLWARLFTTSNGALPSATPLKLFPVTSDTSANVMYPGATTYFRLDTPAGAATTTIRFAAPGGVAFPSSIKPQLAIFRLPAGQ